MNLFPPTRRQVMKAAFGLALVQALSGCDMLWGKPVTVAAHIWPGYELLFLAQRQGWLTSGSATLVETASASESLAALASRKVDGAALTLDEVLRARAGGIPLSVVMIFDISAGADALVARPDVRTLAGLKGRTVAYEKGAVGELLLTEVLAKAQLHRDEVRVVPMPISQQLQAWKAGLADAFITYEPVASQLQADGAVKLYDSGDLPDTIVDVLAFREDVLDLRHGDAVRHVIEAHFTALDHMRHNPQDAAYRMASHLRLPALEVLGTYKGLILPDAANNHRLLGGDPPPLLTSARKLLQTLRDTGQLQSGDGLTTLINPDFLPSLA